MKTKYYLYPALFALSVFSFTSCDKSDDHDYVYEYLKVDQNNLLIPAEGSSVDLHVSTTEQIAFQGPNLKPNESYFDIITDTRLECKYYKAEIEGQTIHLTVYPNESTMAMDGMVSFCAPKTKTSGTIFYTQEGKKE